MTTKQNTNDYKVPEIQEKIARSYINIAINHLNKGEYDKSQDYFNKAEGINKQFWPSNTKNEICATIKAGLAGIHYTRNEYEKALSLYTEALELKKKVYGDDIIRTDVVSVYNNIAAINFNLAKIKINSQGEYFNYSLSNYTEALQIRQKVNNNQENNKAISDLLHDIGVVHENMGNYAESINFYNQALTMKMTIDPNNFRNIAISQRALGASYYKGKIDNDESLKYFFEARNNFNKYFDISKEPLITEVEKNEIQPEIAHIYNDIGAAYGRKANLIEAKNYHQKSINIWEKLASANNLYYEERADLYDNLSNVYNKLEDIDNEANCKIKALNLRMNVTNSPKEKAELLDQMGDMYLKAKDNNQSLEKYKESCQIRREIEPLDIGQIITSLDKISSLFSQLDKRENEALCVEQLESIAASSMLESNHFANAEIDDSGEINSIISIEPLRDFTCCDLSL